MRIIAGTHRGRRIEAPPGRETRPMLDRVREALFSILEARGDGLEGARVLDLFAGTGSLGLEALSRGAASSRFVERDWRTARVLARNASALALDERATVVAGDAFAAESWGEAADVAFLDPPYPLLRVRRSRARLVESIEALLDRVVAPGGPVVFHAPRREFRASELGAGVVAEGRDYGTSTLWILERAPEESA